MVHHRVAALEEPLGGLDVVGVLLHHSHRLDVVLLLLKSEGYLIIKKSPYRDLQHTSVGKMLLSSYLGVQYIEPYPGCF
jgi:hypothetical protein